MMLARIRKFLPLALLAGALLPARAAAQEDDAYVPPPGVAELHLGGLFTTYGSRFAEDGGSARVLPELLQPLTAETFVPLQSLQTQLKGFFAAHDDAQAVGPDNLTLGVPDLQVASHVARVPFSVRLSVLPRVQIGISTSLVRGGQELDRLAFPDATVGENPNAEDNADRLKALGAQWEALGNSPFLPTDSSALGRALQGAVAAAGGDSLDLPSTAIGDSTFNALLASDFWLSPIQSGEEAWRLGDTQLGARVLLLSTFGQRASFPDDSARFGLRSTADASVRFATGGAPGDSMLLVPIVVDEGRSGFAAGLTNDLFFGRHFWLTAAVRYESLGAMSVVRRVVQGAGPFADTTGAITQEVRVDPTTRLSLSIAPRYRVTEGIALGVQYDLARVGAETASGVEGNVVGLPATDAGMVQYLRLQARYTTLPTYERGESWMGATVFLTYSAALSGPAGVPVTHAMSVGVSVLPRLWGS